MDIFASGFPLLLLVTSSDAVNCCNGKLLHQMQLMFLGCAASNKSTIERERGGAIEHRTIRLRPSTGWIWLDQFCNISVSSLIPDVQGWPHSILLAFSWLEGAAPVLTLCRFNFKVEVVRQLGCKYL